MKNIFRIVMAVAILFTASCAKEDISSTIGGGEVEVTFTADLGQLGTRLYGEGDNAKRVYLGVYEAGEYFPLELVDYQKGYPVNNGKASITVVLLKDKRYDLVFWAQHFVDNNGDEINDCPVYSRNWSERSISVSYDGVLSQDDTRDAFFLVKNNFHAGHDETTFELRRPFAQLRAAISQKDQEYIEKNGSTILTSKVEVKGVADQIELYTENAEVSGDETVTFDVAAIPANEDKFIEVNGVQYQQLSMNYILVREKKLVDVTYTFADADGETNYTRPYYNVPIQRNYRTNILGQLISSPMDFTVIINPEFEVPANDYVTTLEDLQAALNAAQPGLTKIVLGADMKGEVTVHQKADTEIILDGNNHKFDGTIKLHNGSNYSNGKITIENVSFETAAAELNFIMPNEFGVEDGVTRRYSNNVIVRNCSFTATNPEGINGVVGVQAKSCKNLQVIGCVATGLHSLVQAQSCGSDVIVKGSTINGKNGVAFKQVANAVVEGCTITAAAYGIRFDGNIDNYGITVKDNTVAAVQPLIVRKMTGNDNTITLEGTNTLTTSETFQIVVTNGSDDEAYSYPTGTYTISGHDNFISYPINNAVALQAAINSTAFPVVDVDGPISNIGNAININRDVVLNMNNKVFDGGSTASSRSYAIEANGDIDVDINDANFTRAGIYAADGADVVFNSGIIDHKPERTSRYIFCAQSGATITINGGTFKNDRAKNAYFWADNSTIYVKGGDFDGVASNNKVVLSNNGQVIISGGTFNFDPTDWLEAGYEVKKVGSKWHVVKAGAGLVTSVDALKTAIANAADGDVIALAAGTYEGLFDLSGKNITIESSEAAVIKGLIWMDNCSPVIKGITLSNPNGVQYPNPTNSQYYNSINSQYPLVAAYNNANPRFENCVFNLGGQTVYGYYGYAHNSPVFEACTFNCNGIRPIANNGDAITVNGCTFNDQYHYSVRIFENQGDAQTVVYTNNTVQGTNTKGEFEGVNISKKGTTAVVLGNFTIEGNTNSLKYRHHKNVTMSDACTYAGDVTAFESEN